MDSHNSLLFYQQLYTQLHRDVAVAIGYVRNTEYRSDIATMRRRSDSEGVAFFTKTLPQLGKSIDKALALGGKLQFTSFRRKKGTELPAFCWWLLSLIFDNAGRERSDASPLALKYIRQLTLSFAKLKLPYDESTTQRVIDEFVRTDAGLDVYPARLTGIELLIAEHARTLVRRALSGLCLRDIFPRHGPGSVATGERPWEKRNFKRFYRVLEQSYPLTEYFYFNMSHLCDRYDEIGSLEELETGTAKVVLVPKDSRGPRLISCEPLELQWIQQGILRKLVPYLESHWLTRGRVNFTDQGVNQRLALEGSRSGALATLDMKEASDRVSLELVKYLFHPHMFQQLFSCRSSATRLPNGEVVTLKKFAPMGSAICFPVEALIFWAIASACVHVTRSVPLTRAARLVYVYGDDIICSSEDQAAIRRYMPAFGLRLNEDKCCTGGLFKESCGVDAYKGVLVTPARLRAVWSRHLDVGTYQSWVELSNSLYSDGYYDAAEFIEREVQKQRLTPYFSHQAHDGIGFVRDYVTPSYNRDRGFRTRFNQKSHRAQVQGWRSRPSNKLTANDDWEELLRIRSIQGDIPNGDDLASHRLNDTKVSEESFVRADRKSVV